MEHLIDLDELARRLEPVMARWRQVAQVGPLTWRDEMAEWPQAITADRSSVVRPESLGLRVGHGDEEIDVCVWTGGWADIVWTDRGEGNSLTPEFKDVGSAYSAVVRTLEDLLA